MVDLDKLLKLLKENKWHISIAVTIALLCFMPVVIDVITGTHPVSYGRGKCAGESSQ